MASKRGNRPGKIKDIKGKKVDAKKASQVKGGAVLSGDALKTWKLTEPVQDLNTFGSQVFKKGF